MVKLKAKNVPANMNIKQACLGVSLHSPNHCGERLSSIIDYINNTFQECIIDLSDTLYKYHYQSLGLTPIEAYYEARKAGDKWIEDNKDILDQFTIPYTIIRWDNWLNHNDYDDMATAYHRLFEENEIFREAVIADACNYYKRKYGKDISNVNHKFLGKSIAYLLEEITCHTIIAQNYECINLYPGKQLNCFKVIRDGLVIDAPYGLQNFGHIRLNLYEDKIAA